VAAPHIVIAGAGIGGLTSALCLARRGIAVTIVEKRTGFGELGAGLQISPNSGRVLDALDLALPLKRVAVSSRGLTIRRWRSGAELLAVPVEQPPGEPPFRLLKRNDLHTVLLDAVRAMPNIRLLVGRGVQDVAQDADGVTVTLDGKQEALPGLALIGADGGHSRVRELSGDAAPPVFTGYEAWRTVLPANGAETAGVTLHLGTSRHAVHYPVAAGREINLVILRQAQEAREGWSREGDRAVLLDHMAKASPSLRDLARSAPDWLVWSLFDRPPAAMAKGRIALIGDAAHPVLPFLAQGASLAIEDAAVLARHLAAALGSDGNAGVPAALSAFSAARAARASRVQRESRGNGRTYHLGLPLSFGRDLVLRKLGAEGMRARYRWLYDWHDEG
jgi:salicylate hydroxylase